MMGQICVAVDVTVVKDLPSQGVSHLLRACIAEVSHHVGDAVDALVRDELQHVLVQEGGDGACFQAGLVQHRLRVALRPPPPRPASRVAGTTTWRSQTLDVGARADEVPVKRATSCTHASCVLMLLPQAPQH